MQEIEGSISSNNEKENTNSLGKKSSHHSTFTFSFPKLGKLRLKSAPKSPLPYSNLYAVDESNNKGDYNKRNKREEILELSKELNELQNQFLLINEHEANLAELLPKYIKDKSIKYILEEQLFKYEKSVGLFKKKSTILMNKVLKQKLQRKKKEKKKLLKEIKFLRRQFKSGAIFMTGDSNEINDLIKSVDILEEKIDNLQEKKEVLEETCKTLNKENSHLKAEMRKMKISYSLEQAIKEEELHKYKKTMEDSLKIGNNVLLCLKPSAFKAHDLYELMSLLRDNFREIEEKLTEAEENNSLLNVELESLREANMRLQENLQKSTLELDNLSRKLDGSSSYEKEKNFLQLRCEKLERDIDTLKDKVCGNSIGPQYPEHHYRFDSQERQKSSSLSEENILLKAKIEALNTIISKYESGGFTPKPTDEEKEKYQALQNHVTELTVQNKYLTERIEQMREENAAKLDQQHIYYQQLMVLQEELDVTVKENEMLKNKLDTEHETLLHLKNERVKYLDEKNVIKAIFQQMKSEIDRLHKVEGTMADMGVEASRLTVTPKSNSVRKFLKHFATINKEREVLLQNQEKYRQKFEELKRRVDRESRTSTEPLSQVKELQIQDLLKEVDKLNKIIQEYEEKCVKEPEKVAPKPESVSESIENIVIGEDTVPVHEVQSLSKKSMDKNEKEQLENTISYLKKNVQRLQHELDEAREAEKQFRDLYSHEKNEKLDLIARLDEEEIQVHNYEKHLKKSEEEIREKENEIQQLSRVASELQDKVNECESLKATLEKVQNEKSQIEIKFSDLQQKYRECEIDLENTKAEMNRLENNFKTALRQMDEKKRILFREYQTKFDKISNQFVGLLQNLDKEKMLYQELAQEYSMVKRDLVEKDSACGHLSMNVLQAKDFIRMLQDEKNNMNEELQSLIEDYNLLLEEKKEIENNLADYQLKYNEILHNYEMVEENMNQMIIELKEARKAIDDKSSEIVLSKKKMQELNEELCQAHLTIIGLKDNLFSLEERITSLEFQKCELTLQLREANGKLEIQSMVNNNLNLAAN